MRDRADLGGRGGPAGSTKLSPLPNKQAQMASILSGQEEDTLVFGIFQRRSTSRAAK